MFARSHGYQPKQGSDPANLVPPSGGSAGSKDDRKIKYLGDVQRLVFNEGDTLVLTVSGPISQDVAERLRRQLEDTFGKDRKYLVLSEGVKLGVLAA